MADEIEFSNLTRYDASQYESEESVDDSATDQLVAEALGEAQSEAEDGYDDTYMSRVDERLEVASYYRQLLRSPLFDGVGPAVTIVQREAQRFFKERLEVLLAIRPVEERAKPEPLPFDKNEIFALKTLAASLLKRPDIIASLPAERKEEAVVRPAVKPAAPPPMPVVRRAPVQATPTALPSEAAPLPQKRQPRTPKPEAEGPPKRRGRPKDAVPFPTNMETYTADQSNKEAASGHSTAAVMNIAKTIAAGS